MTKLSAFGVVFVVAILAGAFAYAIGFSGTHEPSTADDLSGLIARKEDLELSVQQLQSQIAELNASVQAAIEKQGRLSDTIVTAKEIRLAVPKTTVTEVKIPKITAIAPAPPVTIPQPVTRAS